jgi:hypothetical protein
MRKPDSSGLRPWPLALLAIVMVTSGTALLSGDESRNATGEALVVMGGLIIGAWLAMTAASLGGKTVRGWSDKDRKGDDDDDDSTV